MRKIIVILALVLPMIAFAQEDKTVKQTTFEKFTSSIGSIVKFYDYTLPNLNSSYQNAQVEVRKVISGQQSNSFLHISFSPYQRPEQNAFIASKDIIEMKKALEELIALVANDGTGEADYLENKFRINDGSYIGYYIEKKKGEDKVPVWYFNINGLNGGTLYFKTSDSLVELFNNAIAKMDAIK